LKKERDAQLKADNLLEIKQKEGGTEGQGGCREGQGSR
jgi:hypothetical protein